MEDRPPSASNGDEGDGPTEVDSRFTGRRIGAYTLLGPLGRGAMGEVYEARRDGWQVRYALKILKPNQDAHEAEIHQHFRHPNIVAIHDDGRFVDDEGETRQYIVMDHVQGAMPITEYADARRLGLDDRVRLIIDVCRGLEDEIHKKGARHFDIKPANLLVDDRGVVRISDMGLARLAIDLDVHRSGGTLTYMAPEQLERGVADLDERADVYAVGATLYELTTGLPPHVIPEGFTRSETLHKKRQPFGSLLASQDRRLDAIVRRTLEPNREDRLASIGELRRLLEAWLTRRSRPHARAVRSARQHLRSPLTRTVVLTAFVSVAATLIAGVISQPVWRVVKWESIAPAPVVGGFEHVRLVAFPAGDEVESLAEEFGIENVSAFDAASWRAVHAALCNRLGGVAKAIAFDFHFQHPHDADRVFAKAIRGSIDRGTPIICGTERRVADEADMPEISPEIWAAEVQWGHFQIGYSLSKPWIPLLAENAGRTYPSLPLATASACMVERANPGYRLLDDRIRIEYWRPSPDRPGFQKRLSARHEMLPSQIGPFNPSILNAELGGFERGDTIAYQRVDPPPAEQRISATVSLRDVLTDDDVVRSLQDKVVLVFDEPRDNKGWLGDDNGPLAYIHAASTEALLTGARAQWIHSWAHLPWMLALGALGGWVGAGATHVARWTPSGLHARSTWRWLLAIAVTGVAMLVLVYALHRTTLWLATERQVLLNPVPGACALVAGAAIGIWMPLFSPPRYSARRERLGSTRQMHAAATAP